MSGYIVAPNPATTSALATQITVGSSTALKDPVPIPYTTFDGATAFTSASGSLQTLKTSTITLPIGTYMIGTEVTITQSGGAQFTTDDSIYVGFYSAGASTSLIYPSSMVPISTLASGTYSMSFSGIMVLTTAATFTLQLYNTSASTTNRACSWSGTWYQRIA